MKTLFVTFIMLPQLVWFFHIYLTHIWKANSLYRENMCTKIYTNNRIYGVFKQNHKMLLWVNVNNERHHSNSTKHFGSVFVQSFGSRIRAIDWGLINWIEHKIRFGGCIHVNKLKIFRSEQRLISDSYIICILKIILFFSWH